MDSLTGLQVCNYFTTSLNIMGLFIQKLKWIYIKMVYSNCKKPSTFLEKHSCPSQIFLFED